MKLSMADMRDTRDVEEVDISSFLRPGVVEKLKENNQRPVVKIRTLTTKEVDEVQGALMRYASMDQGTRKMRLSDPKWLHENRIALLERSVVKDDPEFPYEDWNREFIEKLDAVCPALIRELSERVEALNRPLLNRIEQTSE
jgi:hypothetical protein